MSDEQNPAPPPATGFVVDAQYIRDLSFEGPAHPKDVQVNEPPKIEVNVAAQTRPLQESKYEVALTVRAQASIAGKNAFLVELAYAAIIGLPPGSTEETTRGILLAEAPRYLFPFARGIVANITREGGFPPLLLQPIDFQALYQQQKQRGELPAVGRA